MVTTDVNVTKFKGDAKDLVNAIDEIKKHSDALDSSLKDVLTHLKNVENGLKNVNNITNNNPIYNTSNQTGNFFNNSNNTIIGARGTAFSSTSSRSKGYKQAVKNYNDYQQEEIRYKKEQVNYEKELTNLKKLQVAYYTQDLNIRTTKADAAKLKSQYYNTKEHLAYEQGLATKHQNLAGWYAEKSAHPEKFLPGSQLHSVRYQTGRALNRVGDTVSSLGAGGKAIGDLLKVAGDFVKSPIAGTATAVTTLVNGIKDLGKAAIQSFAEIESIKTQLGVVFSNQTQANDMFGQISEYAVHSPFGVQQTSELAILLKQSGVYASDLMDTLRMLGDTAGGNMEKMKRIANNYAQIVSIGKASMLDMRQFAYAGIPIFEAVSKELNVSQQELRKLISDGKVTSDIIEKVFKDLTGINGIFENATEKGAKTLKARLQNLKDARQLAFGSIGEWGVNVGNAYGNDSLVNGLVKTAENIYEYIREHVDTVNIENSVEVIKNQQENIKNLEKQIEKAEKEGRFAEAEELKIQLEKALGMTNLDKNRSVLNSNYERKYNNYEDLKSRLESSALYANMASMWRELGYEDKDKFSLTDYQTVADLFGLDTLSVIIRELTKATEGLAKITVEETQAHKESNVINAQQLAFDQANKSADREGSIAKGFDRLFSIYTNSEEYKKKKEEEELKWLKESQKVLKDVLLFYKTAEGNIDISKMSYSKLIEYLDDEKRVLDSGNKMSIVTGKNYDDRNLLTQQYQSVFGMIDTALSGKGNYKALSRLGLLNGQINTKADNETFFRQFAQVLNDELSIFDELIANAENDIDKTDYKNMRKALLASTFKYNSPSEEGLLANPESILTKGSSDLFIPLWKRIISSVTGLSTTGMISSTQTMTNYRDDMAIRNMTSEVLKATMKTMGIDSAMGLMRFGSAATLAGDNGKTLQADWLATKKVIKDFATQLSASTEVISAYKKGLEAELDVYEQLIAAGYTQAESTDLGSQKFVSTKQLEKLGLGNSSQLVNAFGEVIETASGKKYSAEDIKFINGEMYDNLGNKIEEEVVVTGNLFEFIKGELPRIYKELQEANASELNNQVISDMYKDVMSTQLVSRLLQERGLNETTKFLSSNPDYIKNSVEPTLNALKNNNLIYKSVLGSMSAEDIFTYAQMSNTGYLDNKLQQYNRGEIEALDYMKEKARIQEAGKIVSELFKLIETSADELVESDVYKLLKQSLQSKQVQDSVTKAYLLNEQRNQYGFRDPNNLKPRDYSGLRGFRNLMQGMFAGEDIAFDREDFIAETMRNNKDKYGLSEEDLSKTNGELAKMLSLSEQIAITWNKAGNDIKASLEKLAYSIGSTLSQFTSTALTSTFETWGQAIGEGADASEKLEENFRKLGASLASNLGMMITEAGLSMAIHASSGAEVLAGLGLAALGAGASYLSGMLSAAKSSKGDEDAETKKLESLTDQLRELLQQARSDALYYEKNLRHRTALGINEKFSYKSVNDAVITPKGVVMTHPQDYLIATKTPQSLGNVNVTPVIKCNVVNNTNSRIRQEQTQNADGSIDITTYIEEAVGNYIASERSDDAFSARQYRMNGRQSVM